MLRLTLIGEFSVADADGTDIAIKSKKAKALLAYLALSPRKSRSREEIMALLWSDRGEAQARASLRQVLVGLRKDLGAEAVGHLIVTNHAITLDPDKVTVEAPGGGEELLAGFHLHDPAFEEWLRDERLRQEDAGSATGETLSPSRSSKPMIAVLPFVNMSEDPEQEYFSDGITEDIITALSRFRSCLVIARNSSFHYKDKSPTTQDLVRDLGVGYVIAGSVRKLGNRVRVTAQLVECDSDSCIWAENYDRELEDIFAVQDDLTRTVASTIPGLIRTAVLGCAERASVGTLQAYDLLLRARRHLDAFTKADSTAGKELLEKALQLDRTNPRILAALANFHQLDWIMHWVMEGDASLNEAYRLSKKAVELDPTDCFTQWTLGCTYLFRREFERSKFHFEKALELNPHDVESLSLMGLYYTYIGQPDHSLSLYEEAKKVDPHHLAWLPWYYGFTYCSMSRYDDAVDALEPIEQPNLEIMAMLAGCYAHVGRQTEAEAMLSLFLDSAEREMVDFPGRSATAIFEGWHTIHPYKNDSDRERLVIGLQKAGLPD